MRGTEPFLNFHLKEEAGLLPLFICQSFRSLGVSFVSLFSAVYIYTTASSLFGREDIALAAAFGFYLTYFVFKFIGSLLAEEASLRWGLKRLIAVALILIALCLIILSFSRGRFFTVLLAASLWGLASGFFWFGRHGLLAKTGRKGAFGEELGVASIVGTVLSLLSPVIGGLVISLFGYSALFLTALVFIALSGFSLIFVKDRKTHIDTSLGEVLRLFRTRKRLVLAYMGDSAARTVYLAAIPLYLFLILKKELALGEFVTLSMILVAISRLGLGRWIDVKGKSKALTCGAFVTSLTWVTRAFTKAIGVWFLIDVIDRIAAGMVGMPMLIWSLEKALDGHSTGRAMLFREVAISIGSLVSCSFLLLIVVLGFKLEFIFPAAAFFSLLPLLSLWNPRR